jgi:alkylation response protein AidB-like acyl-CoA dehydrogenase
MDRDIQEDIHTELRSVAGDLLSKNEAGADWSLLAEAGWVGLEAPEDAGGADVTFAEVAVILEEMGRATASTSYLGGAVLSVGTLIALQPDASRDGLLADVVAGAVRTAVVLGGIRLENNRLTGRAAFVPDAECADRLLVVATDPGGTPVVVAADGLTVTPQPVLDETRRLAEVTADGVAVGEFWRFNGDPTVAVRRLADRAAVAVACDSLGLADAMLAATVSYAKVRTQFGRPIGSFQAVKHACADMLVRVCVARQLVNAAVEALAAAKDAKDATDAKAAKDAKAASAAASMAKSYACAAAVDVAGKAMQLHGGIGYTWESGIHVYLKRALLNRSLFGSPAEHRGQLAKRYSEGVQ